MHSEIIRSITTNSNQFLTVNLNDSKLKTLISEHNIWGLLSNTDLETKKKHKSTLIKNLLFTSELKKLTQTLAKVNVNTIAPLKGLSLLQSVYTNWNERRMSDIDIYIPEKNKTLTENTLIQAGYTPSDEIKWEANQHKTSFIINRLGEDICIELHYRLYNHSSYQPKLTQHKNKTYTLSAEDELLYLCYHLAEQHNFIKLFWLKDISKFQKKFKDEINYKQLVEKSKKLNIFRSLNICLFLTHKYFNTPLEPAKNNIITRFINWDYLCYPRKNQIKYLLIKFYLKERRSIWYLIHWLKTYQPKTLLKLFKK